MIESLFQPLGSATVLLGSEHAWRRSVTYFEPTPTGLILSEDTELLFFMPQWNQATASTPAIATAPF